MRVCICVCCVVCVVVVRARWCVVLGVCVCVCRCVWGGDGGRQHHCGIASLWQRVQVTPPGHIVVEEAAEVFDAAGYVVCVAIDETVILLTLSLHHY